MEPEALIPETVEKPWGFFRRFTLNELSTVKILHIKAGEEFSLQSHEHRGEFWRVIKGQPVVTLGEEERQAKEGDEFFAPEKTPHRIHATNGDVDVLEISIGDFNEEDIKRIADKYGRI